MSTFIHTDVTAVKLHENFILAGIGSSVSVYRKDSLKFLERLTCLSGQKIYGFVPLKEGSNILVFGGKKYTVISINVHSDSDGVTLSRSFDPVVCDDWLHSGVWLNKNLVALLTAHNTVQIWDTATCILTQQYTSPENSILYSGLLLPLQDGLVVFAGTVFSEIVIQVPEEKKPLHYLKGHRGVIFSISCYPEKDIIVSTSDDRSVRIWRITSKDISMKLDRNTTDYWRNVNIVCHHEVYGHTARVMRSCITDNMVISVGEDSALCFWDYEGKLLRKNMTHQNSAIWSVDADGDDVVTGGGDGAVNLHPQTVALEYGHQDSLKLETVAPVPKKVAFTARRNLVVLDESEDVIHYVHIDGKITETYKLNHGSTNRFLSVSSCKQLVAVANMSGKLDIYVESCKDQECLSHMFSTDLNLGTVFSMHWVGNRHLVFCAMNGAITVVSSDKSNVDIYAKFFLPPCKERWLTAAALHSSNNILVVGDRCGNVHVFAKENKEPIKTFNKVHGRYGPTSITISQDSFITTGRDGTIKYFSLNENASNLAKYMNSKDLEFQWVEKFIDRNQNVVCGFKERIFVIYNVENNSKLLEVPCGGGHRTWDVVRYIDKEGDKYDEIIRLVYVKANDILTHTFQMSKIVSRNVINSTHSKEINCLKCFKSGTEKPVAYCITGGEDTTLRISSLNSDHDFRDEVVFKHLSNVRSLKIFEQGDKVIVVSGGGRAQICIKLITVRKDDKRVLSSQELVSYLIKGTDKQRKNNQAWKNSTIDFDPETRIMDLDMTKIDDRRFSIFAGCSDACLRVFLFNLEATSLEPVAEWWHHKTCILKTSCINFLGKDILITCTTRGEVSLWDVTNMATRHNHGPFFTTRTNKCGINGLDTQIASDNELVVTTAGDDNAVHLLVFEVPDMDLSNTRVKYDWCTDKFHCSQITGAKLVDNFLLTTSIDQRVTLAEWKIEGDGIRCNFLSQIHSDVADIQGMEILSHTSDGVSVCVYGKGVEVLHIPLAS